jgi:hypothetical protein
MDDRLDFSIVKRAGIATAHFARLCGVSRVSAHLYLTNKAQPRGLYREVVARRLALIQRALDKGILPLPKVSRGERYNMLIRTLGTK